jgi:GMP reductase
MRIDNELKLDYSDVLLRPKRSTLGSRKEVSLKRDFRKVNWSGLPIMAANMDGVGTIEMATELAKQKMFTCLKKTYDTTQLIEFFSNKLNCQHTAMSIGITDYDFRKFCDVYSICQNLKFVCIDVANGYSERFVDFIKKIREVDSQGIYDAKANDTFRRHNPLFIIAGNVVTGEMTEQLILNGVDIVKVGIGPGSACTTRIQTGVGYPQLSAVIECADAAHGLGGLIIADGGCTCPGDVVKAFAGGADFVMLGGMLAGHVEGGGQIIEKHYVTNEIEYTSEDYPQYELVRETKKFVEFYGMSSKKANDIHFGGLKDYRAAEGREVRVPYRGEVANTVQEILGGLRSACTYVGADQLKDLTKCATFVKVSNQYNTTFSA